VPSFSVSVNANGEVAYVNEVWNTTLVVTSSDPGAGPPASVAFDCGSGIGERVLSGFIGQISVSCTFADAGQYTVRASVVFQNAVTTVTIPLTAVMRPATSSARTVANSGGR
jgi:PKD repeat protein